MNLAYLEGKKICVVFCQLKEGIIVDEHDPKMEENFSFQCLHGRGNVIDGKQLRVENPELGFTIPTSCNNRIFPNDGTDIIGDAEYFVMVKIDEKLKM
ncbi:MAG: hypothetical protein NE328_13145 [Lentisphaeraceae bacterium]|nr:hypothetical protein [Lentisphaeraceae bacterium]